MRTVIFVLVIMFFIAAPADNASAHKVNLFCYMENDEVKGEGYFSGGGAAQNALIEVYGRTDNELLYETTTDKAGKFSVPLKGKGNIRVVMRAGQGHKAEFMIETGDAGGEADQTVIQTHGEASKRSGVITKTVLGIASIFIIFTGLFFMKKEKGR
jgi:nickel transport protein